MFIQKDIKKCDVLMVRNRTFSDKIVICMCSNGTFSDKVVYIREYNMA